MRTRLLAITACGAGLVSWARASPPATLRPVASALDVPVDIASLPGDPDRLPVLERAGRVRVVTVSTGQVAPLPFPDFSASVCCLAEEGGAQGICLAPDYAMSGHFYVCSTAAGAGDSLFWLGDPGADIDGNIFVNGGDFGSFVAAFFSGC